MTLEHLPDRFTIRGLATVACLALLAACGKDASVDAGSGATTPPTTQQDPPVVVTPPTTPPGSQDPPVVVTPPPSEPPPTVIVTPATSLPEVAALGNVHVTVNGSSATITFDTVDEAADYRVYALPSSDNIRVGSDGSVIVPNAVYRCAGTYQVPGVQVEGQEIQSNGTSARVTSAINGYARSLAEATLGYVYTTASAAANLTPVYAVGNPDRMADNDDFFRFQASRDKKYTTSASEYAQLVASGWRDDGIVFYVPSQASAATKPVLSNTNFDDPSYGARYYLNQGPELTARSGSLKFATAFNVLTSSAPGARPLMRVYYEPFNAHPHDELAVGQAGFKRIRYQGLNNPTATLHYSGLTAETTLVVEALDRGCPSQGIISSQSIPAQTIDSGYTVSHPAWNAIADLQKTVANGEVYLNGQYDGISGSPRAIARAYVSVTPQAREKLDWASTPASFAEKFTSTKCGALDGNCFQAFRLVSSTYDASFYYAETGHWQVGNVLGQFLVNYADWSADSNGKFRVTVRGQKANIAAGSYVHATMEVNSVGSGRRYPQMILSDQEAPVQENLINGRSLVLQTFGDFPSRIDIEVCDHVTWDVNQQCPRFILRHRFNGSGAITGINPLPEEDAFMASVDAPARIDLYASNSRAYILVNGKPYGCANLTGSSGVSPAPVPPTGPVTVTFGDALYHSGADDNFGVTMKGGFIQRHQMNDTSRHYDNLGFASGVAAPAWDETRFPCSSTMTTADFDPGS